MQIDPEVLVWNRDVHMHAADQLTLDDGAQIGGKLRVARLVGGDLLAPLRKRMGRRREEANAAAPGFLGDRASIKGKLGARLSHRAANRRSDLDLAAQEFRRDALAEQV